MATLGSLAVNIVARTDRFTKGISKALAGTGRFGAGVSKVLTPALKGLATMATATGAALAKLSISFNELERSMDASLAIMSGVTEHMRRSMVAAAIEVSSKTRFSASQAADAYYFLASAGMNAEQSLAAMPQVAAFAQAGNFDLATATDLATDAQTALGLSSKDATENLLNLKRVTDVFIKGNTLANTSAQQLSEAMTNGAGAAARLLGMEVEEASATLLAFADQGIKGAEAGTAFGIVLRDLQTKALKFPGAFREAGIAVFDANGEFRKISDILQDVERKLEGTSDAQKKLTLLNLGFSDKSVKYIQTLVGTSEKIAGYEQALMSAGGVTQEVAEKQMTTLDKATAKLSASWETLAAQMGPVVEVFADYIGMAADFLGVSSKQSKMIAYIAEYLHGARIQLLFVADLFLSAAGGAGLLLSVVVKTAEALTGINLGLGDFVEGITQGIADLEKETNKAFNEALVAKTPLEKFKANQSKMRNELEETAKVAAKVPEKLVPDDRAQKISDFIGKVKVGVSSFNPLEAIKGIGKGIGQATLLPKEAASTVAGFITDNTNGPRTPQFAGAAMRGSAEARSAILRAGRDNPIKQVAKVAKDQLSELKEIKDAVQGGGANMATKSFAAEA